MLKAPGCFQVILKRNQKPKERLITFFSQKIFFKGWFMTGDIVQYDSKMDSFKILGRKNKDFIKVNGIRISLILLENEIAEYRSNF